VNPEADLELEEHHRVVRRLESKIDSLLRERQYASLEDAYWDISRQALAARRRLRKVCNER
jgi:hypothetical protein